MDRRGVRAARPVAEVTVYGDEGVVAEVLLVIGGRPLLLIAGELYETWTDDLEFHRLDESVLAFTDLGAADRVAWTTSRQDLRVLSTNPRPGMGTSS